LIILKTYFSLIYLVACSASPTKPIIHYASENTIAIRYSAYDMLHALTAEAIDMAIKHCKKLDKGMEASELQCS